MRICFVGHAFHERTGSTVFLKELLGALGEVTVLTSSPDKAGLADDGIIEHYRQTRYDLWVFVQTEYVAERLVPFGLRNAVVVPMYDGAWARPDHFFRRFVMCRFVSFSRELHARLQALGLRTAAFDYWPALPGPVERDTARTAWSAFFWERKPLDVPNVQTVFDQCRALGISRLHVHAAPDFPEEARGRLSYDLRGQVQGLSVTTSSWFDDAAEYRAASAEPLFFFAPRRLEGIGMASLEAMARGQIVIAPDRPTMNQYVGHLSSGILYDPERPLELPAMTEGLAAELSAGARARAAFGREDWERDVERLKSFLLDDGRRWSASDSSAHFRNTLRRAARTRRLRRIGAG